MLSIILSRSNLVVGVYRQPFSTVVQFQELRHLSYSRILKSPLIRSAKPSIFARDQKENPDTNKTEVPASPNNSTPSTSTPEACNPQVLKKDTFVQNIVRYWKGIATDYADVYFETVKDAKENPKKATFWIFIVGVLGYLLVTNPNERHFNEQFLEDKLELDLVGKPIRNAKTESHLRNLEKLYCGGQIRHQSFGFFSIVWRHDTDKALGIYEARCNYLRPMLSEVRDRIIDVGFANQWWILKENMLNYDINEAEWEAKLMKHNERSVSTINV